MKVEDIHIGQTVQWCDPSIPDIPLARVIGLKEKFPRSPDLRLVSVHLLFERPLFPDSTISKTWELWVDYTQIKLIKSEPWTGRED